MYRELARRLRRLPPSCGTVRVVAIDGPSAAGKTTFAAKLAAELGDAPVIRSDDFPVPWDGDPLAWWPPLDEQVLTPLSEGRPGRYRRYDWRIGEFTDQVEIPVTPILILEGVGAAHAQAPLSYRIWVDAPKELRRCRALDRDGPHWAGAWESWSAAEERHFTADRTLERTDLRLDGR